MSAHVPPLRRNRDFLLLWTGSALSSLGSNASTVAYPMLVLALTGSAADAGLTGAVALLPQLCSPLLAGVAVDRWDRKRVMIWADLLRFAALASIVVALVWGVLGLTQILVVGFVEGVLSVLYKLAAVAAVPNVVHPSHLSDALARNEARERGAAMLGQPLGGVLFGLGRAVPFLFDALSYLGSLVTLLMIRGDFQAVRPARRERPFAGMGAALRWLWRHPFLRTAILLVAGSNFLFRALFLTVIVLAVDQGASPTLVGLMLGTAAVGGLVGSLVAPAVTRRVSMKAIVVGANWAWALLVPVLVFVREPVLIGAVYALMCFVGPLWNVAVSAYQLAVTPDHMRGRVLGAAGTIASGAIPLGSLVGGFVLEWVSPHSAVAMLAGWMLLLAVLATVSPAIRSAPDLSADTAPEKEDEPEPEDKVGTANR